jgi:hypothetical protein
MELVVEKKIKMEKMRRKKVKTRTKMEQKN